MACGALAGRVQVGRQRLRLARRAAPLAGLRPRLNRSLLRQLTHAGSGRRIKHPLSGMCSICEDQRVPAAAIACFLWT